MESKNYNIYLTIFFILIGLSSCSSSTDPYQPYLGHHINYPQRIDTVLAYSGIKRVTLKISKPSDPSVEKVGIFWRNQTDSLKAKFSSDNDTLQVEIDSLHSGSYTFNAYTYNRDGVKSPRGQTSTVKVYGDNFTNTLVSRKITDVEFDPDRGTIIKWGEVYPDMIGSEVKYTNKSEGLDSIFVPANSDKSVLKNHKISSKIAYHSLYTLASTALDTFYTDVQETHVNKIFLKNATAPINASKINTNFLGGKFGTVAQWTVNKAAKNLPGNIGGWRNDNTLTVVTFPGEASLPKNGKIYKTLTLPKGNYSIVVDFYEIQNHYPRYLVASKGGSLPEIKNLDTKTIAYSEYLGTGFSVSNAHLEFSLPQSTKVSFGFLFNMNVKNANFSVNDFYLNYSP